MSEKIEKKTPVFYDIVKNCKGGLTLHLSAFDASMQDKTIRFEYDTPRIRVPRAYALGVFESGTLERMYKDGYFRVEPADVFEAEVAEIFMPVVDKAPVHSDEEIVECLVKNNRVMVKNLLQESESTKEQIICLAQEHIGDISTSMVKDLEAMLQVSLIVEDETNGEIAEQ